MKILNRYFLMMALFLIVIPAIMGINDASADGMTKTVNGIKATLKIDRTQDMVDLYLTDTATQKPITDALASADIRTPKGNLKDKHLLGMKMAEGYSYMNKIDMKDKGEYVFDITVEYGKKQVKFNFSYNLK